MMRNDPSSAAVRSALAGLVATGPMTLLMRSAHRRLPAHERYSLPPEIVTTRASRKAGVEAHPERPGWEPKTWAAHFGFGTAAGAGYGLLGRLLPGPPGVRGMLYGLGVWTASYLGWLPAAGLHPSATREPRGRNVTMIVAHLVWGAVTGLLASRGHRGR